MGTHVGAVEKNLAKLGLPGIAQHRKGALPYPRPRPADVQLRRSPPRAKLARDRAPLGAVALAPDHRFDRLSFITQRPARAAPCLIQRRLEARPLAIAQYLHL